MRALVIEQSAARPDDLLVTVTEDGRDLDTAYVPRREIPPVVNEAALALLRGYALAPGKLPDIY